MASSSGPLPPAATASGGIYYVPPPPSLDEADGGGGFKIQTLLKVLRRQQLPHTLGLQSLRMQVLPIGLELF